MKQCEYLHNGKQCFAQKNAPLTECQGDTNMCEITCENPKDMVNHPDHYTAGGIECIDALEAATVGIEGIEAVCTANAIKYLWRWKYKNGAEDLKKAIWYINHLIEALDNSD